MICELIDIAAINGDDCLHTWREHTASTPHYRLAEAAPAEWFASESPN